MKNKEQDCEIKNKNYFILTSIIVLLFILMMTIVNLNYYVRKNKEGKGAETENALRMPEEKQVVRNLSCLIIKGKDDNQSNEIVEGSLEKAKIGYISKSKFEDITDEELSLAKIIIINGSEFNNIGNVKHIFEYLKKGKHIIFTSIPDVHNIEASGLEEVMGIRKITESKYQEGIKFLSGFMLGGLLELPEFSYNAPEIHLLSTTKAYVTGSKDTAVVWRNTYNNSEIYVVNGPFLGTNAGYGILSAIMAQIHQDYIYPVINAKAFTYTGLPYSSYENTDQLEGIYSRNAMQLQQDILIPDVLSINKSRNLIPSGFLINSFHKEYNGEINKYNEKQINNYEKEFYKLGGEVGMVYTGDLEKDSKIYHYLFNKNSKSILLNNKNLENLNELIVKEQFSSIESIFGPWTIKKKCFGYLTKNTVYIPFTLDGIVKTDLQKIEFYSAITAFGVSVQNLNLEQIIFPQEDKDNWMYVLREYVKFIDSYRNKFQMIEARNITDTAQAVKKFESNSPTIEYFNNKIKIEFQEWYGESYFILRTNKEIDSIIEGTIEKIEEGAYLVTAKNKEVDINLRQIDKYE